MLIKSNILYDILKYLGRVGLPAVAVWVSSVSNFWGWDANTASAVSDTIVATAVLLNSLLEVSNSNYNKVTEVSYAMTEEQEENMSLEDTDPINEDIVSHEAEEGIG